MLNDLGFGWSRFDMRDDLAFGVVLSEKVPMVENAVDNYIQLNHKTFL